MSKTLAKALKTEPLKSEDAKWIRLVLTTYKDPLGKERTWEYAERQTRPVSSPVDAVGIVAIIDLPSGPEIVLQRQYRPPVNAVCIEIPAGLVDEGETPEQAAVRELKEETGYVGEASMPTSIMLNGTNSYSNPGFCNTNLKMIHMTIDMNKPENQNPQPELEENEFIEVFTLPLKSLFSQCEIWEREGYALDARVATLAEGIEMAKRWKL
ncbi:putative Nudix hydrolase P35G2.12 [Golovinomyces cichoracearum]|uniref:Putative Nudix hydrolase P35G2.12 n=1 Tax=Golovinomyces cichoracearum TaxID=62708 RepID=A0A420I4Z6_9PEZI|nr:putative Nudix hydrolase P35G2.12 [Golovinomyces cichoracearum]